MGNNQSWEPPAQEPPRPGHLQVSLSPFLDKVSDCVHVMFCSQNHNFGLSFGLLLLMPYNGYMGEKRRKPQHLTSPRDFKSGQLWSLYKKTYLRFLSFSFPLKSWHTGACLSPPIVIFHVLALFWFPFYFYPCFYSSSPLLNSDNSNHLFSLTRCQVSKSQYTLFKVRLQCARP